MSALTHASTHPPTRPSLTPLQAKDILRASWCIFGKWGHLRLFLKNGKALRCDGFNRNQEERIKEIFETNYSLKLERETLSSNGVNYGKPSRGLGSHPPTHPPTWWWTQLTPPPTPFLQATWSLRTTPWS